MDKRASARMPKDDPAETAAAEEAAEAGVQESKDVETLKTRLEEEKKKAEGYLANWQRAAADHQNFKRRVEREREEYGRLATAAVIINFLPTLDDLERALQNVDVHLAGLTWVDGVRLIYRKLQAALEAAGVTQIQAEGENFDPNLHEAVMYGEGEEGKVVSEIQRGYKLGDRVLRPAMVVVGQPSASSEGKEQGEDKPEGEEGKPESGEEESTAG